MNELEGRVAVVTGASSGIGLAIAKELASQGMSIVMASQNAKRLSRAEAEVAETGATVLAVPTDVEKKEDVERLAERTLERFGGVHVLVNNAGVYEPGYTWEIPEETWEWIVGVNLWGTIHGLRVFIPHLLEQDEAHVVNVASAGGLMTSPCNGPYAATKHAMVGLSKSLRGEFAIKQANIGLTLVCPGGVTTGITTQLETTGPGGSPRGGVTLPPEIAEFWKAVDKTVEMGIPSDDVGPMVSQAIRENRFWVLPNAECYFPVFDHELAELKDAIRS